MEKLQKKKWLFLAVGAVFIVLWIALGVSNRDGKPEAVVRKFYQAFMKHDVNKMVKCYPPQARKEMKEELKEEVEEDVSSDWVEDAASAVMSSYKIIIGDVVYGKGDEANTAKVACAVVGNGAFDSGVSFDRISVIKIGNKWYIDEY